MRRKAGRAGIVEDVLLGYPGIRAEFLRLGIKGAGLFHPGIHRKGFQAPQTEEQDAVGHLSSHTGKLHQSNPGLGRREKRDLFQREAAFCDGLDRGEQIGGSVSSPQKGQLFQGQTGQSLGRGKGVQSLPFQLHRVAEGPAQPIQNGLDAGDAVTLGNQKGDQGLPGILTEDAQS